MNSGVSGEEIHFRLLSSIMTHVYMCVCVCVFVLCPYVWNNGYCSTSLTPFFSVFRLNLNIKWQNEYLSLPAPSFANDEGESVAQCLGWRLTGKVHPERSLRAVALIRCREVKEQDPKFFSPVGASFSSVYKDTGLGCSMNIHLLNPSLRLIFYLTGRVKAMHCNLYKFIKEPL